MGVYGINQGDLALNSGNYDLSYQGNNLTITKALLNVIADGKTKVYGDADPSLTYQVSGLKNGDTAGAVLNGGSLSRVAGENVGVYGINQGGLGLVSANYDLSYQGNNLTITKALLNVIADAKTKGRGADADAGGDERALRIVRHGVLVHRDVRRSERRVGGLAGQPLLHQADQHQVVVGAAGYHVVAAPDEHLGHRLGVADHLRLVVLEARLQRFLEAHRLGRDHVHQRAALGAGEYRGVELLLDLLVGARQDQAPASSA